MDADLVEQFMMVTGASASRQDAESYLEMCGWDVAQAIALFFENGPITENQDIVNTDVPMRDESPVRAVIPSFTDQILETGRPQNFTPQASQVDRQFCDNDRDTELSKLFKLGEGLNCDLPFTEAMMLAASSKKFVLVNLQHKESFDSLRLNRDIWNDEIISDLLRESFLMWQRDYNSEEAGVYSQFYKVLEFPYIGVIDPRTGRQLKQFKPKKWIDAQVATEQLSNFLDGYTLGEVVPSASASSGPPTPVPEIVKESAPVNTVNTVEATVYEMPPESSEETAIKLQIKLPDGKRHPRRISPGAPLAELFKITSAYLQMSSDAFELETTFPKLVLRTLGMEKSVSEAGLAQSMVIVRLL